MRELATPSLPLWCFAAELAVNSDYTSCICPNVACGDITDIHREKSCFVIRFFLDLPTENYMQKSLLVKTLRNKCHFGVDPL